MAGTFSAQVAAEVAQIKNGLEMVVRQSAQDLDHDISTPVAQGGNFPVDTGFARNSRVAALNSVPDGPSERPDGYSDTSGPPSIELVLAGFEMGDAIYLRWTANYMPYIESGSRGRPGRAPIRQGAQKWAVFIAANAARLLNGR